MRTLALAASLLLAALLVACGESGSAVQITTTPSSPTAAPETPSDAVETVTETPIETPPTEEPTPTPTPGADGTVVLECGDTLAPVDKRHRLPEDCAPGDLVLLPAKYSYGAGQYLRAEAADAVMKLIDAAAREGVTLLAASSYRSYADQVVTFNSWAAQLGEDEAARVSARPGHSEHQLGTTTDIVGPGADYNLDLMPGTPEAAWIAANAARFGFVVSYPEGMEDVTGYIHEPWHIRYVGADVAADVAGSGLTLAEYLHSIR